jgi:poly-gamma-glutamate capsule biosynthesis protein CapA/YwtB (metallophosphatase superfamily)
MKPRDVSLSASAGIKMMGWQRGFNIAFLIFLVLGLSGSSGTVDDVTLALLGDVMLGRGVAESFSRSAGQSGSAAVWERAFAVLSPYIARADLTLANLESPLSQSEIPGDSRSPTMSLCASAASIRELQTIGFDLFALANNHTHDCPDQQPDETRNILRSAGLEGIPPGYAPLWRSIKEHRLAFFAFDDISSPLDWAAAQQAVKEARSAGGIVIISLHWGLEYDSAPSSRQVRLAQELADAGAALIWGHHPHVLQPAAWVQGKNQPYPTLVAYSLGNALFDQYAIPDANHSALVLVHILGGWVRGVYGVPFEIHSQECVLRSASPETARQVLDRLKVDSLGQ